MSTRLDTTGSAKWSTGKCARNWNSTMPTNRIYTTQHLSLKTTHTNGSPNLGQNHRPYNNQQKEKEENLQNFSRLTTEIKLKECEKRDKYPGLARELKKLWNMKVTIIQIMIGAFVTVTKWLLKGLENLEVGSRVETIQKTAFLKTDRILRRVLETSGDLLSLNLQWKTISVSWCEKL